MPRKRRDPHICPVCGTRNEPVKTWQLVSPIPDSRGRITITVMGSFVCTNCGHKWRAVISKLKVGGSEVEVEAGGERRAIKEIGKSQEQKREGEVFEIDIEED